MNQTIFFVCFVMVICQCLDLEDLEYQHLKLFPKEKHLNEKHLSNSNLRFFSNVLGYLNMAVADAYNLILGNLNMAVVGAYDLILGNEATTSVYDLKYTFYDKTNQDNGEDIRPNNFNYLRKTSFSGAKLTIFSFHGWGLDQGENSGLNLQIRTKLFEIHDVNLFVVGWSKEAERLYSIAFSNLQSIGNFVADFIKKLKKQFRLKSDNLIFIGFSLGAHLAGYVGRALNGDVDTIIGLDPAGPLFEDSGNNNHLAIGNARFVQIIHTNGFFFGLGYEGATGDSDYFVNGGKEQPGCMLPSCHHSRAYQYFSESLGTNRFVAQRCDSYEQYINDQCNGPKSSMGMLNVDKNASGTYYLNTNSESPFAKG